MGDNKVNVLFLGDTGSGKTTLLYKYKRDEIPPPHITIGVELYTNNYIIGKKCQTIRFWDCAGTESYRPLIKHYYGTAQLYVIVFDITNPKSYKNIDMWLKEIGDYKPDQILLVGNKNDMKKFHYLKEEYDRTDFTITYMSAHNRKEVKKLFETIHKKIVKNGMSNFNYLPYLDTPIIRNHVEEKESFCSKLCKCLSFKRTPSRVELLDFPVDK